MRLISILFFVPLALLIGCQSPTNASSAKTVSIDGTGWYVQNLPADWWSDGSTTPSLVYEFSASMSKNTLTSDIASFDVYLPGTKTAPWSFEPKYFDEASHAWGPKSTNAYWSADGAALPLGTMDVVVTLNDGRKLTSSIVATQPGSTTPGPTVVANENSLSTYANKVAALPRPVVTSATKAADSLTIQFTENDPGKSTFNGWVWLYDGTGTYLGGFFYFRDRATPHTPVTQLNGGTPVKTDGSTNVLVLPLASLVSGTGVALTSAQLTSVGFVRVLVCDGGQYASMTGTIYDYRSISAQVPVK